MFGNLFSGWHIVILVVLVVLLFGATKLPALAKGVGESLRILRKESRREEPGPDADGPPADGPPADGPPAAEPPAAEPPAAEPPAAEPPQRG